MFYKILGIISAPFLNFFNSTVFPFISPYIQVSIQVFLLLLALLIVFTVIRIYTTLKSLDKNRLVFLSIEPPHDTTQSPFSTEQLFSFIYGLSEKRSFLEKIFIPKERFSFEIVSTKEAGIRYVLVCNKKYAEAFKRVLISFLPGAKIKEIVDCLPERDELITKILEFKLAGDHTIPLRKQNTLEEYDPIAYLTGNMTKLEPGELISLQLVISPKVRITNLALIIGLKVVKLLMGIIALPAGLIVFIATGGREGPFLLSPTEKPKPSDDNWNLQEEVRSKTTQKLFKASLRVYAQMTTREDLSSRLKGIVSSFGTFTNLPYQRLTPKIDLLGRFKNPILRWRIQSLTNNPTLSVAEVGDIYHLPYSPTTKTEDLTNVLSPELPAPLSLKDGRELDVVFAKNSYGNKETDIGLTDEERAKHLYLVGRTGSGKSTVLFQMAKQDIQKGRGLAVIDPHGDLAEDLLSTIPEGRINDLIYFNPFDLSHPIGINLLELPEGLTGDELEMEKELVAESVISVFRRVFAKNEQVNAHRIEYILRNAIYTSFYVPDRTIFTVYNLLNNPNFQRKVTSKLDDENLKNFWDNEFGRAGDYQVVKMVSGVTAKVGRFLFSPSARRILEQEKSTINFDEILDQGKILICNLAEGKIGEDTAQILGLTVISKIHQAALRRVRNESRERKPFYLFVDEFQNFATTSFTKILSGGRKFGLRLSLAEQSTAQQSDRNVVNVILANTGTVICFATASPLDEQMMQPQFAPNVTKYDLANLARYNFYIKMASVSPQEPFSGQTLKIEVSKDPEKIKGLIEASRKNYAIVYQPPKTNKNSEIEVKRATTEHTKTVTTRGDKNPALPLIGG